MSENEIKTSVTIKEGYMGGSAFTGCNYKGYMRYSDINKVVKKAFKAKYPTIKVSCTGSSFSGGQSCDGTIKATKSESIKTIDEFKEAIEKYYEEKHYCFQVCQYLNQWDCDLYETPYDKQIEILYNKYIKQLSYSKRLHYTSELDEMILKPTICEAINYLNALYDSFNDCDNNGMVDYFSNMFYKNIELQIID